MCRQLLLIGLMFSGALIGRSQQGAESKMFVYFNADSSSIYVSRIDYFDGKLQKAEMRCDLNKAAYEESCKLYHNGQLIRVYPHDQYEIQLAKLQEGNPETFMVPLKKKQTAIKQPTQASSSDP